MSKTLSLSKLALCTILATVAIASTSCYRMPCADDYSVIPVTNNRDITGEGDRSENNTLPTLNY